MQVDEALALLDELFPDCPLSNLQETVFSQVWDGKTYAEIAEACSYEHNYIRDVGFRMWQTLSAGLGQKISKSNIKAVLGRYARHRPDPAPAQPIELSDPGLLEFPAGPVPLHSRFYIERPPIEAQTFAAVLKPGSLIRLKAPQQMGKTSLLQRIVAHAERHQLRTVSLRFDRADREVFSSIDRFLRWFCANVSRQLNLEAPLDAYWNADIGSKVSCSAYLEDYVLQQIDGDVVIALDELNELFHYPDIASDFLPLLRSWYDDARESPTWQRLHWVLAHATDVCVPGQVHQSPLEVGLAVKLPPFTLDQVQELARRHGLPWADHGQGHGPLTALLNVVSCRPGLVRLALYALARYDLTLPQLMDEAPTQSGLYSDHLRKLLADLSPHPELSRAFSNVIQSADPVTLDPVSAHRLESLGLISLRKNQAIPSCELYRQYFLDFLPGRLGRPELYGGNGHNQASSFQAVSTAGSMFRRN